MTSNDRKKIARARLRRRVRLYTAGALEGTGSTLERVGYVIRTLGTHLRFWGVRHTTLTQDIVTAFGFEKATDRLVYLKGVKRPYHS